MELRAATGQFIDHRRGKLISAESIDLYRRELHRWLTWRAARSHPPDLAQVALDEIRGYFVYLRDEHVPHAANRHRTADDHVGLTPSSIDTSWRVLRACWRFCEFEGWLSDEQKSFFRQDRIPRPKVPDSPRPAASASLISALLKAIAESELDAETIARDRVMVLMLFESGLRVGELIKLTDKAIQVNGADDDEGGAAKVIGKGGKFRWVFWGERTARALRAYLRVRSGKLGGELPLFRGTSDRNRGGPMTRDAVRAHLKRVARWSGMELPKGAPVHSMRHGFVHAALDAGLDISEVAQLAGHANIQTTMIYARRNKERLKQAHKRIFGSSKGKNVKGGTGT